MDSSLIGSIIEATATFVGILLAAFIATRELAATREQIQLSTYENIVNSERQLISLQLQDAEATKALLKHFNFSSIPESAAEGRGLLSAFLQIQVYESMFYRHEKGYFPQELWEEWDRSMANSFKTDVFLAVWEQSETKEYFWKSFVDHVNRSYFHKRV